MYKEAQHKDEVEEEEEGGDDEKIYPFVQELFVDKPDKFEDWLYYHNAERGTGSTGY